MALSCGQASVSLDVWPSGHAVRGPRSAVCPPTTAWPTVKEAPPKSFCFFDSQINLYSQLLLLNWTYDIPLWGTTSNSNIEILQRFQNKILRSIANAPRYVPNTIPHTGLQIPTVKAEITNLQHQIPTKAHHTSKRTHTRPTRRRRTNEIKTFQTNWTNHNILISTAHRYENIWCEDIQWDITPQVMQFQRRVQG